MPFHIVVEPSSANGLNKKAFIKTEKILTISKKRLVKRIGILEEKYLKQVGNAIKLVLDLY